MIVSLALALLLSMDVGVSPPLSSCLAPSRVIAALGPLSDRPGRLSVARAGDDLLIDAFDAAGVPVLQRRVHLPGMRCDAVSSAVDLVVRRYVDDIEGARPDVVVPAAPPNVREPLVVVSLGGGILWPGAGVQAHSAWHMGRLNLALDLIAATPTSQRVSAVVAADKSPEVTSWSAAARAGAGVCWSLWPENLCVGARVGLARVSARARVALPRSDVAWRPQAVADLRWGGPLVGRLGWFVGLSAAVLWAPPAFRVNNVEVGHAPRFTWGAVAGGSFAFF